jgi:hypothetical protein
MINLNTFYATLFALGALWYECGDDFGIFCYRIGCGVFSAARERAVGLVPLRATTNPVRTNAACSNLSFTFSAPSTTRQDYKN